MTFTEREPQRTGSVFELVSQLKDSGDGLLLSRNRAQLVYGGRVDDKRHEVHYEDIHLNTSAPEVPKGKNITDRMRAAAYVVAHDRERAENQLMYPVLEVKNRDTGAYTKATLDVARLILDDNVPIYSQREPDGTGDEHIVFDTTHLLQMLAGQVGVDPLRAILQRGTDAWTLANNPLMIMITLKQKHVLENEEFYLGVDSRDAAVLRLLQLEVAERIRDGPFFYKHPRWSEYVTNASIEVAPEPDMQSVILELIDEVEHRGEKVYVAGDLKHEEKGVGVYFAHPELKETFHAASDTSLTMALYKAYLYIMYGNYDI